MPRKEIKRQINGFDICIRQRETFGYVNIRRGDKSVYLFLFPHNDSIFLGSVQKSYLKINSHDDEVGIVTIEGFRERGI